LERSAEKSNRFSSSALRFGCVYPDLALTRSALDFVRTPHTLMRA